MRVGPSGQSFDVTAVVVARDEDLVLDFLVGEREAVFAFLDVPAVLEGPQLLGDLWQVVINDRFAVDKSRPEVRASSS